MLKSTSGRASAALIILGCIGIEQAACAAIWSKNSSMLNLAPRLDSASSSLAADSRDGDLWRYERRLDPIAYEAPDRARSTGGMPRFDDIRSREKFRHFDLQDGAQALHFDAGRGWRRRSAAGFEARGASGQMSYSTVQMRYELALSPRDSLQLGGAMGFERRNLGLAANRYRGRGSSTKGLTFGWQHDEKLKLDAGWYSVSTSQKTEMADNLVTAGLPVAERGPQVTASYTIGSDAQTAVHVGMTAGAMTLNRTLSEGAASDRDIRALFTVGLGFR